MEGMAGRHALQIPQARQGNEQDGDREAAGSATGGEDSQDSQGKESRQDSQDGGVTDKTGRGNRKPSPFFRKRGNKE